LFQEELQMNQKLISTGIILIILISMTLMACIEGDENTPSPEKTDSPSATVTTESGLQYIEIEEGTGLQPQTGDTVKVHYTGTLEDGTEFDSSVGSDPAIFAFGIDPLIPGFTEGIGMMKESGKAKFIIPPELGYGDQDSATIPANSTLIFEVELLSVQRPSPPQEVAEDDYKTTESGLKYHDFITGNGPSPKSGDFVVMHSAIWMLDGTPLGNTYDTGQPQLLPASSGNLIPGLEEGLAIMHMGGKQQMVIPPELGYGEEGIKNQNGTELIPPNTTLIVEVDLLGVIPVPEPTERTEVNEEDYTTTSSGLKYYDLETGDGPSPEIGQQVVVHYTGWLTDGTKFDTSIDRGQPLTFALGMGQMIPGFDEGVATMKVGGKRQLVIPPELGYGSAERGSIPANSILVFEVELDYIL